MELPLTCFFNNCWLGNCCIKSPSVTGTKAQVAYRDDPETLALAFCSVTVSLLTRHVKIELLKLFCGSAGGPKQPAADAKAQYDCEGTVSLYPYCCGRNGDAAMALRKRDAPSVPPKAIECSMTDPATIERLISRGRKERVEKVLSAYPQRSGH